MNVKACRAVERDASFSVQRAHVSHCIGIGASTLFRDLDGRLCPYLRIAQMVLKNPGHPAKCW